LPFSDLIALFVSLFFGIEFRLICLPLIKLAAAYDVPPSTRNSASIAIMFWRKKRPSFLLM